MEIEGDSDILYNRVIVNMKRLLKKLTGHSNAIDSLERKLREISAPKKKPEKQQLRQPGGGDNVNNLLTPGVGVVNYEGLEDADDLDQDNDGIRGYQETPTPPEYKDEIDKLSDGAVEREIMMD